MNAHRLPKVAVFLTLIWLMLVIAKPCFSADFPSAYLNANDKPAEFISAYHFFKDPKRQMPNDRVIPYDLNTPHFADYANLHRFIWLPAGESIIYHAPDTLEFPISAVVIITIGYFNDIRNPSKGERLIETRLFIHKEEGWTGLQYIWNKDTTDAHLSLVGGRMEVSWLHYDGMKRTHTLLVPNKNQCKQCHEIDGAMAPLGPIKARYINRDFSYRTGTANQLSHWTKIGYLTGAPKNLDDVTRIPVWNDPNTGTIEERARAYLDMNCSSCHRPKGLAYTSGLDLTYDQKTPVRYGVFKAPVAAGL